MFKQAMWEVYVGLHTFLDSALHYSGLSASRPGHFNLFYRRLYLPFWTQRIEILYSEHLFSRIVTILTELSWNMHIDERSRMTWQDIKFDKHEALAIPSPYRPRNITEGIQTTKQPYNFLWWRIKTYPSPTFHIVPCWHSTSLSKRHIYRHVHHEDDDSNAFRNVEHL
jgi:hypothetical protein